MNDKTVLISGGGIAGPTLAFWLKAAGFKPTLIEAAPALRTGGYVIDFWGLGYDIAERMELREDIHRIGYYARELRIVNAQGKRVAGFGTKVFSELTGGRYVTLGRSDLSRLLFAKIKHDTEVIFGNEIVRIEETPDDVRVNLRNGGERRFDLVIGADGLHSAVRKLVFGTQEQFEKRLGYLVAAFEVNGYRPRDDDVYVMFCEPGRMLGRFALHGDRTLFLFVFAVDVHERLAVLKTGKQKDILRRTFGDGKWECLQILDELDRADDLYIDHVSQIIMPGWSKGRVALVGDAAFCVSLTAGQGTALAMTAAYVLAGELARAGGRHGEAFGNYEKILRDFIVAKQEGAERFASAFTPKTKWGLFFRNLVVNATAIPGLARLTFGRDIVDKLVLPPYQWPAGATPS